MDITQEELHKYFEYDRSTGIFTNKISRGSRALKGQKAGWESKGHIAITFKGKKYQAHRLAWIYVYGELSNDLLIDHKDMNGMNNSIDNLRLATRAQNNQNRYLQSNSTSGVRGVYYDSDRGKWVAQIKIDGKAKYLGSFLTIEEASECRNKAAKEVHGEYYRDSQEDRG